MTSDLYPQVRHYLPLAPFSIINEIHRSFLPHLLPYLRRKPLKKEILLSPGKPAEWGIIWRHRNCPKANNNMHFLILCATRVLAIEHAGQLQTFKAAFKKTPMTSASRPTEVAIPIAQPLLLLPLGLKALRSLHHHLQQYPQVPFPESGTIVIHGEMHCSSASHTARLYVQFLGHQYFSETFWKKVGCKFWFQDLFWPTQNMTKSLEFILPFLPFLSSSLPEIFFNSYIFLPDITFKLCTYHLPLCLYLALFYIYSPETAATNHSPNR